MRVSGLPHMAYSFLKAELEDIRRFEMPWRRRVWLYRNGFFSEKDAIWDVSEATVDEYLSDLQGRAGNIMSINATYRAGLENKVFFHLLVSRTHDEVLPDVHGLVRDGRFVDHDRFAAIRSIDGLCAHLADEPIVVKPIATAQGDDVHVLDARDGHLTIDGRDSTRSDLSELFAGDHDLLLEAYIPQAEYAAAIYPDAANTVRVITMVDPATESAFVAGAMHRFGTTASGPVDNASAGGITAGIDPETGELSAAMRPPDTTGTVEWLEQHPDTDARIAGTVVPGWEHVRERILELADEYRWLWPYVAWDVVVTDDQGSITVVEGNHNPGTKYIQAHQPLLADDRVRRFYDHHDVI